MSFRRRLILFLVGAFAAVQLSTAGAVYWFVRHSLIEQGKQQLAVATEVFVRQLDAVSARVTDEVQVLALDYPLRQAIAQHDRQTALSALRNHGHRVGATWMLLVGLDGRVAADTQPVEPEAAFPFSSLLQDAATAGRGAALVAVGQRIYWMVVVAVRAPVPIAFIAAGVPVDDALLESLRQIGELPKSIALMTRQTGSLWLVVTHSAGHSPAIPTTDPDTPQMERPTVTADHGREYITLAARLATAAGSQPIVAVLDYPLDDALRQYRPLVAAMLIILGGALAAAIAGAMLIARGVSRPVEALAATARRIEAGDYAPPPRLPQSDELGHLSAALTSMAQAIGEREGALLDSAASLELARDEAVRANRAKSNFLANMSHELRTPLNAIIGFSEIMHGELLGPVGTPGYRDYAGHIHDSGRHLLALVEEMLDLAKVEAGRLTIEWVDTNPASLLLDSIDMLRPEAAAAGIEFCLDGDPLDWPMLLADSVKLKQVFLNLLGNAVKFTPAGGRVSVCGACEDEEFRLRISDTGIGIRAEDIPLVMQPFYRVNSAYDGKHQGAGLGLPFAKAVVELHGGSLDIESRLGAGTTVTVVLPSILQPAAIEAAA